MTVLPHGLPVTAQEALRWHRAAIGAERRADQAAASREPWALRNLRVWQASMARALACRSLILRAYLDRRAAR